MAFSITLKPLIAIDFAESPSVRIKEHKFDLLVPANVASFNLLIPFKTDFFAIFIFAKSFFSVCAIHSSTLFSKSNLSYIFLISFTDISQSAFWPNLLYGVINSSLT